jgi:hypothetical protein
LLKQHGEFALTAQTLPRQLVPVNLQWFVSLDETIHFSPDLSRYTMCSINIKHQTAGNQCLLALTPEAEIPDL